MKQKNLILKSVAFLLGLIVLTLIATAVILPHNKEYVRYNDTSGILHEPEQTLDYVVLGDSESYCSISPLEIWKEHGFAGYVAGIPVQKVYQAYDLLEKILEEQSPKVVLIETNMLHRGAGLIGDGNDLLTDGLEKAFPIVKRHNGWKYIDLFGEGKKEPVMPRTFKGFRYNKAEKPYTKGNYTNPGKQKTEIPFVAEKYLNKIAALCEEKGIQLIFYTSPSPSCWAYAKHNAIKDYAAQKGISFIDLNLKVEELGIDWATDTMDNGDHLNIKGARKSSRYMGDYLASNSQLPDRRKEPAYAAWNTALEDYLKR